MSIARTANDWKTWFQGDAWTAMPGQHFHTSPDEFTRELQRQGLLNDREVAFLIDATTGAVKFQFYDYFTDAPALA
ncbi:hypothetical protein ACFWIB_17010 [Streptomyces sp. NPDC127051]|uniref:hypothetical protein n=1 Tax=Streptomyces sp. NPDC127051 TaxID=3347119 RepID=UPI003666AE6F